MQKKHWVVALLITTVTLLVNCTKKDQASTAGFSALPLEVTAPPDNVQTPEKMALGKMLFFDPILSGNNDIACATCHHPSLGFADARDLSIGVNGQGLGATRHFLSPNNIPFAKRNSLSIINTGFNGITTDGINNPVNAAMFFDNRTHSLELQSVEPMKTLEEMRGTSIAQADILDTIILRLKNIPQYSQLFNSAFQSANAITVQNLGKAIASYERSILSNQSPFDKYMRGDKSAMSSAQLQGMNAFAANGCNKCHSGSMFSDYALHVLSVPDNAKQSTDDGANGSYAFRTPSLRNLLLTAPYMHSGVFSSLNEVLNFYDQVGEGRLQNGYVSNRQLDGNLQRINRGDAEAIIQFLDALNDGNFDETIPGTVPSGLHSGGNL